MCYNIALYIIKLNELRRDIMPDTTKESLDWLDTYIDKVGNVSSSLIPVLQSVQTKYKYLPEYVCEHIAQRMNIPLSHIYGVATFYAQFSTEPKGKHIVQVCNGTACHVRGAADLINRIKSDFGLTKNFTTDDMFMTLEVLACIGACAMAPAVIVDGQVHGQLTPDKISKVLDEMKKGSK